MSARQGALRFARPEARLRGALRRQADIQRGGPRERGLAQYIAQLGYRDDSDRVDGRCVAEAISVEPDASGEFAALSDWVQC